MTVKERASCINTIKLLQRLALNVHGMMDVIDAENCDKIIKMLEADAPQWIPCSVKYPESDERVLVTSSGYYYYVWDCMSNRGDDYFWEDEDGLYHNKYEVVAWMPLPEPYKERREE